jgi:hypothetical protein
MRFLAPSFLGLLWLALVPVVLYLFRRKSRTVRVSTLLFFKSLAREHRESPMLRHLKRLFSLLMTLLILTAPIIALARLVVAPRGAAVRSVVIALDRSASMAALDAQKRSRLVEARSELRSRLDALSESVPVALIVFDARPDVVQARTTNRRALLRALDDVAVRPIEDNLPAALAAADRIAALEPPSEIWLANDREADRMPGESPSKTSQEGNSENETAAIPASPPVLSAGVTLRHINAGLPAPINAGLTALDVKKLPLLHLRYQAYVQVGLSAGSPSPQTAVIEPQIGGLPLARREVTLAPGEAQGLTIDVEAAQEQILSLSVQVPGDCLELDNHAVIRLPAPRPLVVAYFAEKPDPFTELALKSLVEDGEVEVFTGGPAQWAAANTPDVWIFEGWLPEAWPAARPAVVINPPRALGPVRALRLEQPVPRDHVRVTDDEHPVLFRVSSSRMALTQTAALDASGSLQPLWLADGQAVLMAGEQGGQRLVVMGFSPVLSEQLPLTPSYPLLLGNALFWSTEKSSQARIPRLLRTGTLVDAPAGAIEWREWRDGRLRDAVRIPVASGMIELDRLGLWHTAETGAEGSSLLLSRAESNLTKSAPDNSRNNSHAPKHPRALMGDLSWLFLWLVIIVLIVESWLFHRHAVS